MGELNFLPPVDEWGQGKHGRIFLQLHTLGSLARILWVWKKLGFGNYSPNSSIMPEDALVQNISIYLYWNQEKLCNTEAPKEYSCVVWKRLRGCLDTAVFPSVPPCLSVPPPEELWDTRTLWGLHCQLLYHHSTGIKGRLQLFYPRGSCNTFFFLQHWV